LPGTLLRLVGVVVAIAVTLVLVELSYRVYHLQVYGTPLWQGVDDLGRDPTIQDRLNPIAIDTRMGWRAAFNYRYDGPRSNVDGTTYEVHVTSDDQGFRMFGDPGSRRPKIFVVGDSFTQAVQVSDSATYFAIIGRDLGAEIFAYGVGGHGSLQKYLALDEYIDRIRPDLLVWQYCSNNFVKTSFELESQSVLNNNRLVRPYLEGDQVVYRLPVADPLGLRTFWGLKSRALYAVLSRWDSYDTAQHAASSIETTIQQEGLALPAFRQAVETTDRIMGMVRARVGSLPIVAFNCDDSEPYAQAWEAISARYDIHFFRDVAQSLGDAEALGQMIRVTDGHWNETGDRLIAMALEPHVRAVLASAAR
jgi:hypothetical protein